MSKKPIANRSKKTGITPKAPVTAAQKMEIRELSSLASRPSDSSISTTEKQYIDTKLNNTLRERLKSVFASTGDEVLKTLESIPLDYRSAANERFDIYVEKEILPQLKNFNGTSGDEILKAIRSGDVQDINTLLNLDLPLKKNPLFRDESLKSKIIHYSALAGLSQEGQKQLLDLNIDPQNYDPVALNKLDIKPEQSEKLRLSFELGKLSDDHPEFVRSLFNAQITSVKTLTKWNKEQWLNFIKNNKVSSPDNLTAEAYIANIMENLKTSFPSAAFLSKTLNNNGKREKSTKLLSVLNNHPRIIDQFQNGGVDWKDISVEERSSIEKQLPELQTYVNTYKYLGLQSIFEDQSRDAASRLDNAQAKIMAYETFVNNNFEVDLLQINFFDRDQVKALNWIGVDTQHEKDITNQIKAYQRVMFLSEDADLGEKLVSKGFDSAHNITQYTLEEFATRSQLSKEEASWTYDRAIETSTSAEHGFELARLGIHDKIGKGIYVGNWETPDYTNQLKDIDGFDELFGSQDFCDCDHCRSIFSPAAYFVDLMYFIEKNVSDKVFKTRVNHALYLKNRRPDLWKLKLSCENTNKLVPYLDIVNQVLEEYLKRALSITDVYQQLSAAQLSFNLPFNLYLEEIRIYLSHFNITLFDVFKILKHSSDEIWRERLNLTPEDWAVITTADVTNQVRKRIGDPSNEVFNKFNVKEFIHFAGITRQQLDDLLKIKFSKAILPINIIKEQSTDPATDPLINYVERIVNLNNERLDFIHRFIRLWRKTGWTIGEFDLIATSLKNSTLIPVDGAGNGLIQKEILIYCAQLLELQEKLKLKVEEIPALFTVLPETPVKDNQQSFFIRSFGEKLFGSSGSIIFHHAFKNNDGIIDPKLGFLLGGLAISEFELIRLFELLETEIVFDGSGNTNLTKENAALLYRHARIAKGLKLSIEEFILAMKMIYATGNPWIDSLDKIFTLIDFKARLQKSKLKVSDLWFILTGEAKGSASFKITQEAVHEMVKNLQVQATIYFNADVLADIPGVSAKISEEIVQRMVADGLVVTVSAPDKIYKLSPSYQLTQDFTAIFTAISAAPSVVAQAAAIREQFNEYHAKPTLTNNLAKLLNVTPAVFQSLLPFTTVPLSDAAMYTALYTDFDASGFPVTPADLLPLENLVKQLGRLLHLFSKADFKEEHILFLSANTAVAGITSPTSLTLNDVFNLLAYKTLVGENPEKTDKLHLLLINYQATAGLTNDELVLLAETWKTDKNSLLSLIPFLTLSYVAIEALSYMKECLDISKTLGLNGESLVKLKQTTFSSLAQVRDIVRGAFASKYPDEKDRYEKLEPYHDKINTKKRDALCDFIIAHNKELKFMDLHDLYAYFLLDVEVSGCFRTSWIVAANSSLQLYVHRCLMNLEQAAKATVVPDGNNDPDDNAFEFVKVLPAYVPADEWEWRKNYRVWEANRKVFLYPENYILPELRDNKTPLFRELEDELLQQKITLPSTEQAYQKYIAQFAELARLKISGSYFHESSNTYYFFGKTSADPPVFYMRQWQNQTTWSPWEKIELAINSTHVSAIIYAGKLYLFWTEIKVEEETSISGGNSSSAGYNHELEQLYSCQDENKKWSSPQRFSWSERIFGSDLVAGATMNRKSFPASKDKKLYTFYSDADFTASLAAHRRIDLYNNKMLGSDFTFIPQEMLMPVNTNLLRLKGGGTVQLIPDKLTDRRHEARVDDELIVSSSSVPGVTSGIKTDVYQPELSVVGRKYEDFIFRVGNQQYLVKRRSIDILSYFFDRSPAMWRMIRLSTSLPDRLGEKLFMEGLDKFLSLSTQKFTEDVLPFTITDQAYLDAPTLNPNHVDFKGAYGEYYRELFFHIPFLIASHLNANQKFKDADFWYRKIFDPTSAEFTTPEKDRNWQYIEFRGLSIKKLQQILTDASAIAAYRKDPFNPHAIARLRLNAYQKTIVMKYIDNLLDWGDYLFAQDTMESINEATMLYIMAYDILGKRPAKLGKCSTAAESALTYDNLGPAIGKGSEFLIQLENYSIASAAVTAASEMVQAKAIHEMAKSFITTDVQVKDLHLNRDEFADEKLIPAIRETHKVFAERMQYQQVERYEESTKRRAVRESALKKYKDWKVVPSRPPHREIIRQKVLAFCIPHNEELLKYWDRVEDRLFKIRNCMNISGVRRQLALFQPPIDPMMLVKAKAAGLSLEDILSALSRPLPHYRFTYLLEKAKQIAQTVQSFGGALLSALEKKDVEELILIRSVNEKEILELTRQIKKQTIQEAQNQHLNLLAQEKNVQNKINHFSTLIDEGLNGWEITQQVSRHVGTVFHGVAGAMHLTEAIALLIPNAGSPFAMTYGGKQLGKSFEGFADWLGKMATVADAISQSAGLEATFQRREEEWDHSLLLAEEELKGMQKQVLAAELKVSIAERDLEIHEKNAEHLKEVDDFYKSKFTNLALYNFMATTLTRLYREAYNICYDIAMMTQRTYQLDTGDDTIFIAPDNWQFDKAGLLAGERLHLQLHRMEKAYMEKNARKLEVTQAVSLYQWAPDKLVELKQKGSCTFQIPELAFDMVYPGQYNRMIKSVRISIPCVTGPYTNVSCKLSLIESFVRKEASADADLVNVSTQKLASIATSHAENDGGLFEMSFSDERYLPFEGAGAVSTWAIELPNSLRLFDYSSITDVILHINYTAADDGVFKEVVEQNIVTALTDYATANGLFRLFSLRHDFPDVFHRLMLAGLTTQTADLELTKRHFPYFLQSKELSLTGGKIFLKAKKDQTITTGGLSVKLNTFSAAGWTDFPVTGTVDSEYILKEGTIPLSGDPFKKWKIDGSNSLKKEEVDDILLLLKYSVL